MFRSVFKKRFLLGLSFVLVTAWATVFGPFPISAIGPDYVSTTFASDQSAEFEGAVKVAQI